MRGPGSDTRAWTDLWFVWHRVCRKQSRRTKGMLFIEYGIDSHWFHLRSWYIFQHEHLSNAESWIPWFFFTNILWNCESKFHLNIHFLQPGLFYITCGVLCVFADLCQQDIARRPTHLALKMMDFQPGIMLNLIEPTESQPGGHHNQQGGTPQPSVCVAICGNAQWTCVCHIVSCVHYLIYCCKVIDVFLWQLNGCESTVM